MNPKTALGFVLAGSLLLGCNRRAATPVVDEGPSDAEVKELLSRAAGMSGADFMKLLETRGWPRPEDLPNPNLTLMLLATAGPDFQMKAGTPEPSDLADALVGGRSKAKGWQPEYASVIRPPYIKDLQIKRTVGRIAGSVAFEAPGLYEGNAEFTIVRAGADWKVTRLAMPGRKLALQLAEDGTWKTASE